MEWMDHRVELRLELPVERIDSWAGRLGRRVCARCRRDVILGQLLHLWMMRVGRMRILCELRLGLMVVQGRQWPPILIDRCMPQGG